VRTAALWDAGLSWGRTDWGLGKVVLCVGGWGDVKSWGEDVGVGRCILVGGISGP
jgi:hypothetical protein